MDEHLERSIYSKEVLKIAKEVCPELSRQEMEEAVDEIVELYMQRQLFTKDEFEDYMSAFYNRETVVKALAFTLRMTVT